MTRSTCFSVASVAAAVLLFVAPVRAQDAHTTVEEAPGPPVADSPRAAPALPDGAASDVHFELVALGGYMTPAVHGGITPFGLGAGGGLGFAFGPVYVGVNVLAYAGGSDSAGSSEHSMLYGVETGYELHLTPAFTLRPFFGVGGATITHTIPAATSTTTVATSGNPPVATGSRAPDGERTDRPAPDVVTQATSVSTGGGGGVGTGGGGGGSGGTASTSDTVSAPYVEPGIQATLAAPSGTFVGLRASLLYFPSVAYGSDASATYMPYALHLTVGQRW